MHCRHAVYTRVVGSALVGLTVPGSFVCQLELDGVSIWTRLHHVLRHALERGEAVMGFNAEIHRRLVVLHGWQPAVDSLAPDQEREPALRGDGAEFALREYRMRGLQQDVLELTRPWLVAVIEDLDAPHLVRFEGLAHRFVYLSVGGLALLGLWFERWCERCHSFVIRLHVHNMPL